MSFGIGRPFPIGKPLKPGPWSPLGRPWPELWLPLPEADTLDQEDQAYGRAACDALGLPYWRDVEAGLVRDDIHHLIGTFRPAESDKAIDAVVATYNRVHNAQVFLREDYLKLAANIRALQKQKHKEDRDRAHYEEQIEEGRSPREPDYQLTDDEKRFIRVCNPKRHTPE